MKPIVFINDNRIVTDSLTVADVFSKEHKDVLKKIDDLDCSSDFRKRNFSLSDYKVADNNKPYKKYLIKRDGLVFLVMGYTGTKAARFKEMYIEAFNKMENELKQLIPSPSYMLEDPIDRAKRWIEEQVEKKMLEQKVAEYAPKVTYYDLILKSNGTVTVTQIAKDYSVSGKALNKILNEEGIQYKMNGQWLLYGKFQDKGYTKSHTHINDTGKVRLHTRWTQKGRLFIHNILGKKGIIPIIDREIDYMYNLSI
jgi:Rha family phage regulatory protein